MLYATITWSEIVQPNSFSSQARSQLTPAPAAAVAAHLPLSSRSLPPCCAATTYDVHTSCSRATKWCGTIHVLCMNVCNSIIYFVSVPTPLALISPLCSPIDASLGRARALILFFVFCTLGIQIVSIYSINHTLSLFCPSELLNSRIVFFQNTFFIIRATLKNSTQWVLKPTCLIFIAHCTNISSSSDVLWSLGRIPR